MPANLKKSMNPHGCVEMWKCDFPLISLTSSPSWHVPFLLHKGTCQVNHFAHSVGVIALLGIVASGGIFLCLILFRNLTRHLIFPL